MKKSIFGIGLIAVAGLLVGCGRSEKSSAGAESKPVPVAPAKPVVKAGDEAHPIPLERAIAEGICGIRGVSTMAFNSRFVDFSLSAKVETKPWIRIEAGWMLRAKSGAGAWVTALPVVVQLARTGASVHVPAAEITRSARVPDEFGATRVASNEVLSAVLRAADVTQPLPSWNVVQAAVTILTHDTELRPLRAEKYSAPQHNRGGATIVGTGSYVVPRADILEQAGELLRAAGVETGRFKAFGQMEAAYAKALADWTARRADLQALQELGFFRTRPEAFEILSGVWASRPMDKKFYRETAVRILGDGLVDYSSRPFVVDAPIRAALQGAATLETDAAIRRDIAAHLARAEKAENL